MLQNLEQTIREYLPTVIHMSLATSKDGQPWVCEVHYSYDEKLNLYFRSLASRRHSLEISKSNKVAGNIVQQHDVGQKPRGVYFEGTAEVLENVDEHHPAYITYAQRFDADAEILEEAKQKDGHKFYKITVKKFYVFDSRESKPSTKYELQWN